MISDKDSGTCATSAFSRIPIEDLLDPKRYQPCPYCDMLLVVAAIPHDSLRVLFKVEHEGCHLQGFLEKGMYIDPLRFQKWLEAVANSLHDSLEGKENRGTPDKDAREYAQALKEFKDGN